jgi:hypothetical protein
MDRAWVIRSDGIENHGAKSPGRNGADKRGSERAAHECERAMISVAGHWHTSSMVGFVTSFHRVARRKNREQRYPERVAASLSDHRLHKGMSNDDPRCGQAHDCAGQAADQDVKAGGVGLRGHE